MIYRNSLSFVRITHIPTGVVVTVDTPSFRSQHAARDAALSLLRAKLYALANIKQEKRVVASYRLPDGDEYPHELSDFREPLPGE